MKARELANRDHPHPTADACKAAEVLEQAPDLLVALDTHGKIVFANRELAPAIGLSWISFASVARREHVRAQLQSVLLLGIVVDFDGEGPGARGATRYACRLAPWRRSGQVVGAILAARDKPRNLAPTTISVGAVAHAINNPLAAIVASVEQAIRELESKPANDDVVRDLKRALAASSRISGAVRTLVDGR